MYSTLHTQAKSIPSASNSLASSTDSPSKISPYSLGMLRASEDACGMSFPPYAGDPETVEGEGEGDGVSE